MRSGRAAPAPIPLTRRNPADAAPEKGCRNMLKRAVAVAAMVVVAMIAAKDGRLMRASGFAGACSVFQTYGDSTKVVTCAPGRFEGRPDLSHEGCRSIGMKGATQYWRCSASFDVGDFAR
jgi:hypothetical protein